MNIDLMKLVRKQLERKFPAMFPAKVGKHQASKRGYKHVHNLSKGERNSLAHKLPKLLDNVIDG